MKPLNPEVLNSNNRTFVSRDVSATFDDQYEVYDGIKEDYNQTQEAGTRAAY